MGNMDKNDRTKKELKESLKMYEYKKPYSEYGFFKKLILLRYYLIVPYKMCIYLMRFIMKKNTLSFKHDTRISIRYARFLMGKRNYK